MDVERAPITITLREAAHCDDRNSLIEEWAWFARHLVARGEVVVFVRDTARANEPLDNFVILPDASKNLHVRMALYQAAKINFFVSNGPWNLGLFSDRPYAAFIAAHSGDPCNLPDAWELNHGVAVGTQFPWALPKQRVIWQRESYRLLCEVFEEFDA